MVKVLQTSALPEQLAHQPVVGATLAALGIVYGDIGTSPLYALKQAVAAGGPPDGSIPQMCTQCRGIGRGENASAL